MRYIALIVLFAAQLNCANAGGEYIYPKVIEDFVYRVFEPGLPEYYELGTIKEGLLLRLGKPNNITSKKIPDRGSPGSFLTRVTLYYEGIEVIYDKLNAGDEIKTYLYKITIDGRKVPVKYDLIIGTSKDKYTKILGEPNLKDSNSISYFFAKHNFHDGFAFAISATATIFFDKNNNSKEIVIIHEGD